MIVEKSDKTLTDHTGCADYTNLILFHLCLPPKKICKRLEKSRTLQYNTSNNNIYFEELQ